MEICRLSDNVTIIHGDCLEAIPELKFDAIVTDPPYGINFIKQGAKSNSTIRNMKAIHGDDKPFDPTHLFELEGRTAHSLAPRSPERPLVMFGANHFCKWIPQRGSWLVWDKSCGMGGADNYVDAEFIWMNRKSPRCIYRHFWKGCFRAGQDSSNNTKRSHPSMKPVELMAWLIEVARIGVGKVVLDPYMGIGSTGIACLQTGRKFIGIEIDREYFEIAKQRLQKQIDKNSECFDFAEEEVV